MILNVLSLLRKFYLKAVKKMHLTEANEIQNIFTRDYSVFQGIILKRV